MKKQIHYYLGFIFCLVAININAQISEKSPPPTTLQDINNDLYSVIEIPSPDVTTLLQEDSFTDKHGIAMRFAVSTPVNINLPEDGTWMQLNDGSSICRIAITSKKAQALIMYYREFKIPKSGKLFLYDESKRQSIGAFTNFNNRNGGKYATEMIYGETTILEYWQPAGCNELPVIIIDDVSHVYRTAERIFGDRGFGGSGFCEVNIKCPEGDNWQEQAGGEARIIVKQGSSEVWCTGSLLNNERLDHTPYFLTADHCGPNATPEDYDQWIFYFRYQGSDCENPINDTAFNSYSMVGASKIAAAGGPGFESDFKLLRLNESVPLSYEPYYNGWSAKDETSGQGVTIHHPQGDIKKISTYTSPLISTNWGSVPNTHWKVVWSRTETNFGVTEGGSSGSPIFNSAGVILGQLTGGDASCTDTLGPDYYGKFSHSWNKIGTGAETRLQPWLDPDNTGIVELGGLVSVMVYEQFSQKNIKIFPNPCSGIAFVDFNDLDIKGVANLQMFDVAGRIVFSKNVNPELTKIIRLDLTEIEKGIYFVSLITDHKKYMVKLVR